MAEKQQSAEQGAGLKDYYPRLADKIEQLQLHGMKFVWEGCSLCVYPHESYQRSWFRIDFTKDWQLQRAWDVNSEGKLGFWREYRLAEESDPEFKINQLLADCESNMIESTKNNPDGLNEFLYASDPAIMKKKLPAIQLDPKIPLTLPSDGRMHIFGLGSYKIGICRYEDSFYIYDNTGRLIHKIDETETSIGRSFADVTLPAEKVSGRHLGIEMRGPNIAFQDFTSTNGTRYLGSREAFIQGDNYTCGRKQNSYGYENYSTSHRIMPHSPKHVPLDGRIHFLMLADMEIGVYFAGRDTVLFYDRSGNILHNFINKKIITIGKAVTNDFVISTKHAEIEHARIVIAGEEMIFQDLKSSNGTFYNGNKSFEGNEYYNNDYTGTHERGANQKGVYDRADETVEDKQTAQGQETYDQYRDENPSQHRGPLRQDEIRNMPLNEGYRHLFLFPDNSFILGVIYEEGKMKLFNMHNNEESLGEPVHRAGKDFVLIYENKQYIGLKIVEGNRLLVWSPEQIKCDYLGNNAPTRKTRAEALRDANKIMRYFMALGVVYNEIKILEKDGQLEILKAASKKRAKEYHPDRFQNLPSEQQLQKEEQFKFVQEAYQYLVDILDREEDLFEDTMS